MKLSVKAGVPLMELIIAIGIFSFVGILILRIFLTASYLERFATDSNTALIKSQSVLETIKAENDFDFNDELFSELGFNKSETDNNYFIYFDKNWEQTELNATFVMKLDVKTDNLKNGIMVSPHVTIKRCESYPFLRSERDILSDISCKQYYPH